LRHKTPVAEAIGEQCRILQERGIRKRPNLWQGKGDFLDGPSSFHRFLTRPRPASSQERIGSDGVSGYRFTDHQIVGAVALTQSHIPTRFYAPGVAADLACGVFYHATAIVAGIIDCLC